MMYECELENGRHLELENEGDQTFVSFSHRGAGQQQRQGTSFNTGEWTASPTAHRAGRDLVVRLETDRGPMFLQIRGNHAELLNHEPSSEKAERIEFTESAGTAAMPKMKPMEPMRPMEPMEPMEPMRPMELKMGNMKMSMGGAEEKPAKKFCTQCGKALRPTDRFCGNCGHEV